MISADFLLTALVVVLIPGTGVLFTISAGLFLGRRASLFAAVGCTLGILPHLAASLLGLAALLHVSAVAFTTLKYAGCAYLLYLAWSMWRSATPLALERPAVGSRELVLKAFLMNILNPKLSLFFLAFLPQFVAPQAASPLQQMLVLSAVFMLMTFGVFIVYGLLAHAFRTHVVGSRRVQDWLRRGFAGCFAALGVELALAER